MGFLGMTPPKVYIRRVLASNTHNETFPSEK